MAAERIGQASCPLCGSAQILGLTKNGLPCMTCSGCKCQIFARGDRSDELLRARLIAPTAPAAPVRTEKPAPAPVPTPAPAAPVRAATATKPAARPAPAAPVQPAPVQPPEPQAAPGWGWGAFG